MKTVLIVISLALIFSSCQGLINENALHSLTADYTVSDSEPMECPTESHPFYGTKVLFVIDKTSKNKKLDPQGQQIRNVKNLVQNHEENVNYSVLVFSKNKVISPISEYDVPLFTSDKEKVVETLSQLEGQKNEGKVNYSDLFQSIQKALNYDAHINPSTVTDYHIVFVSGDSLGTAETEKKEFAKQINDLTSTNNVYIHSIYYGKNELPKSGGKALKKGANIVVQLALISQGIYFPTGPIFSSKDDEEEKEKKDNQNVEFLKSISGNGRYIDTETSDLNFKWSKPWKIKHFFVYNTNASECLDGSTGLDSDQDGLCDEDELSMRGFDPYNRFSFKGGYSDTFQFLFFSQHQTLPDCQDNTDVDHDLLTHCEEKFINSIEGPANLETLQVNNPDSDGDGVIDGMEALLFLKTDLLAARNPNNLPEYSNDMANVKAQLYSIQPQNEQFQHKTELVPIPGESSSCYALRQNEMPLYFVNKNDTFRQMDSAEENTILVYFLKEQEDSNRRVYQFKYEKMQIKDSSSPHPFYSSTSNDELKHYTFQAQ